ncbi:MAG: glycosyltransferase family 4 protein [Thermoplasmatota archaeon]
MTDARPARPASHAGPDADRGRPRLCFHSFNLVHLYRSRITGMVGGAEVQYRQLAAELATDFDIHVVTITSPQDDLVVPPHHTLHTVPDPQGGRIRRFTRRSADFWAAFKAADAACYFQRGAGFATFLLALHCKVRRRPFVFHWASDDDLDGKRMSEFPALRPFFKVGRKWAAIQVCQTEHQLSLLSPRERRRAVVIPNVLDHSVPWRAGKGGDRILWVGSVKPQAKRPDLFLDLAAALPGRRFRMVGDLRGPAEFQQRFRARLAELSNVEWAGFVERRDLPAEYAKARVLVNTSDFEGFPNTFLEAAACGVPIVSLNVDPNGILAGGAGRFLAGDVAGLPGAVEALHGDTEWRKARAACAEVAASHSPQAGAARLRAVLERLGVVPGAGEARA